jgi:hypothetical protein
MGKREQCIWYVEKDPKTLIMNIVRDANGVPRNILSNLSPIRRYEMLLKVGNSVMENPSEEVLKEIFTLDNAVKILSETLKYLEFQHLQKVLDQYGYKDLGDVQYWHSQNPNDPEPKGLLEW